ncbi:hypothetical protein H2200_010842 [Cladophialophora chaetospira]|uniref:Uncharacterized protein n=1 Tax=Cladophialophora chaetospira TaxID=386627 RepID=A0AA38X0U9_9EURO|nr:hypothetical protein H2200_010842 [Cladophialophora chaetospira]
MSPRLSSDSQQTLVSTSSLSISKEKKIEDTRADGNKVQPSKWKSFVEKVKSIEPPEPVIPQHRRSGGLPAWAL